MTNKPVPRKTVEEIKDILYANRILIHNLLVEAADKESILVREHRIQLAKILLDHC